MEKIELDVLLHQSAPHGKGVKTFCWAMPIVLPVVRAEDAPVVVMQERTPYRAYDGDLIESHLYSIDSLRKIAEEALAGIDSKGVTEPREFYGYPFQVKQRRMIDRNRFHLRGPADDHPTFDAAEQEMRERMEGFVVVDGKLWRRSLGPTVFVHPDEYEPLTRCWLTRRTFEVRPRLEVRRTPGMDLVSRGLFSAFDYRAVAEAFGEHFETVVDSAGGGAEILSEEGWSRQRLSDLRNKDVLESVLEAMSKGVSARARIAGPDVVRALVGVREALEGERDAHRMLAAGSRLLEAMPGAMDRTKSRSWRAAIGTIERIGLGPCYEAPVELNDFGI